jgi:hypothetical protein
MLYKRPIIALTSLLDLLFILIFAYQMDIKSDADKYVQAEVEKMISLEIPDQSELVAELQKENQSVKEELEIVRKNAESIDEYKLQLEEYKTQRYQLRDKLTSITNKAKTVLNDKLQSENYKQQIVELGIELQKKERELVAAKQESERIKKQPKTEGVIPITDKDAELDKALVGTWKGSNPYRWIDRSYRTTLNPDNSFIEYITTTANRNGIVGTLRINKGESISVNLTGTWWVKGGYIHRFVESSTNTKAYPIGLSSSSKILSVDSNAYRFQEDDNRIGTDYRIKGY